MSKTDVMLFSRIRFLHSLLTSPSLVKPDLKSAHYVSTSPKHVQSSNIEATSSRLLGQEIFSQAPTKLVTRRAEEERIEVEEIGWAGQPIMKRLHTSIPEVQGDVSDIFKAVKKTKAISEFDNNLEVQVGHVGRSHDIISAVNKFVQSNSNDERSFNETTGRLLHTKKNRIYSSYPGILTKSSGKLKKKKRTVVVASKPAALQSLVKNKKHKRIKAKSNKSLLRNQKINSPMVLNRLSMTPLPNHFLHIENRQFKTFSASNYAKAETSKLSSKSEFVSTADCVCPEILYSKGKKKTTKICGQAAGAAKGKKKSSWKQKMCLVQPKDDPGRKKTLVCMSEAAKQGKRKKELPKCPEPEKHIAPRVVICAPNLEEEKSKKSKKECVKVEEVKIRKKTKVCKPVIIFAKEEVGVQVEKKAVCVSKKVKKVVSRHTKICPPEKKKS